MSIPTTREEAIVAVVESDVAQWGEGEREGSKRMNAKLSLGLALNTLASRAELARAPEAKELRKAANAALTKEDRKVLRTGG